MGEPTQKTLLQSSRRPFHAISTGRTASAAPLPRTRSAAGQPPVVAIVGMDGCGKSSTYHGVLEALAPCIPVAGVGDVVLAGGPDDPIHERDDVPFSRSARTVGRFAKGLRWRRLYRSLKFIELTERTHMREYVASHAPPDAIVMDGQPLVNCAAWSAAHFFKDDLVDDEVLLTTFRYLAGEEMVPLRSVPRYLRRAWPLVALNRLHISRFRYPDLIFHLDLDPAVAVQRIHARGKPLQAHETEADLGELGRSYARVCRLFEQTRAIPVKTIRVDEIPLAETVRIVAECVLSHVMCFREHTADRQVRGSAIDVIATTMSGSIQDQRKVGDIGPEFRRRTSRPVRVHTADSHDEAEAIARDVVARGGRTIVSAGGAGTFNAVLEGAHVHGEPPQDLRLGFLRKGSADLIGKVLGVPDDLPAAAETIIEAIEADRQVPADVLTVRAASIDGKRALRHMVGFGGVGIFGEVPRFTESRIIKVYKGVLGSLFGDYGPFTVGLALAALSWLVRQQLGRVPEMSLTLDDEEVPPATWGAVIVLNGDLGSDFPLGRGMPLDGGVFRVVALRYTGLRNALRQMKAARSGAVIDRPDRYDAVVRSVRELSLHPVDARQYMVNVDGGRLVGQGETRFEVSGRVRLIRGASG